VIVSARFAAEINGFRPSAFLSIRADEYAMSVDKSTVQRIASLARIRVPEEELETLAGELSQILDWVEQLEEVDTDGVTPMASSAEGMELRWRDDVVTDGDKADDVLANAPDTRNGYFVVPKVIE
jgi:aspartyl-tRNA(Asn)/glutamyl-tRNA(Gln) amidotransferase subunit C